MRTPPAHYSQFAPPGEWQEAGARSPEEFERWRRAGCGMACLQMILAETGRSVPGLVELGLRCATYGGYVVTEDKFEGLIYAGFVDFVSAEWGLEASVAAPLALDSIIEAVTRGAFVIASVHRSIREPDTEPPSRGGHLVLVFDSDDEGKNVYLNNPSGLRPEAERGVRMPTEDFERFFAGRGMVVEP
jgi:hypothetical protein